MSCSFVCLFDCLIVCLFAIVVVVGVVCCCLSMLAVGVVCSLLFTAVEEEYQNTYDNDQNRNMRPSQFHTY